jgi:hypothetical protein
MPRISFADSGEKNPHNSLAENQFHQPSVFAISSGIEVAYLPASVFSGTRQSTCSVARAAGTYVSWTYDLELPLP